MHSACPVCLGEATRSVAPFRHEAAIFAGCMRAVCDSCGMSFASPMPSDPMLAEYNAAYFANAHGGPPTNRGAIAFFSAIARLRLAYLERFISRYHIGVEKVLELGPGPGYFARSWLAAHERGSYSALETDKSCHAALCDLGVELVDHVDMTPVDAVVMCHVLEHVPDPFGFVKTATQGLRPGGVAFIEVPCRDWEHKVLDEPHILFFDKESMLRLLSRLGFVDIELGYFGQPISALKRVSRFERMLASVRTRMINLGVVAPFAKTRPGMESLSDPFERAMVGPFMAHKESVEPAWWLRAVARKA